MDKPRSQVSSQTTVIDEKILHQLENHPFFKDLAPAYVKEIASCAHHVHHKSGENLFREGDPSSKFYAILSGKVVLQTHSVGRGQITLETVDGGSILGWSWILPPPYKKQFEATAIGETSCIEVNGACIRGKCESDPKFGYELLKRFAAVIGERLQATRLRLLDPKGEFR